MTLQVKQISSDEAKAHAFAIRVRRQVQACLQDMDDNADEEIKGLADHAFDLERFQWDTI